MKTQNLIMLAVFAMALLCSLAFIIQPSYAVSFVDKTVANNPTTMVRHVIGTGASAVTVFSTIAESTDVINTYSASDGSLLYSTDLTSVAESQGVTAGTAVPRAMTCSGDRCNVLFGVTHGTIFCEIVNVVPSSGSAQLRLNMTSTNGCASAMGQSGNSLYVSGTNGNTNDRLAEVDITQSPYVETELNPFVGMGSPTACIVPLTLGSNFYIGLCGSGNNSWFKMFRVSTATTCNTLGNFIAEDVATDGTSAYVSLSTGDVKKVSSACAVSSTISTATCGGEIHDIDISGSSPNVKMFTFCEAATAAVTYYNLTANSKLAQYDCSGSSAGIGNYVKGLAYDSTLDVLACASYTGNSIRFIYQNGQPSSTSSFCQTPGNENLLRCRLEAQGGALNGTWAGNPQSLTSGASGLLIQAGFLDGSNTDPKTNGTGYIFLALAILFFNLLLMLLSRRFTHEIPFYVYFIMTMTIIMLFVVAGMTDVVVLIIAIVAIVALAAPRAVNLIGGIRGLGQGTGGDSS